MLLLPGVPESLVRPRNGARRWISLVVFDLQPSELARVAWCLLMACCCMPHGPGGCPARFPVALTAIAGGLIVVEPDLGTTLLFVPASVTILIAAGGRIRHLLMFLVPAALIPVLLIGGMLLAPEAGEARLSQVLMPHQVDRIVAYTAQLRGDPRYDDDIGYQAAKALLATASGGVTGLSREGAARAVRLSGLPEAHNDMVFVFGGPAWRAGSGGGVGFVCRLRDWGIADCRGFSTHWAACRWGSPPCWSRKPWCTPP